MDKWEIDLNGTYVLGVSGGCDSMTLLDKAYRKGYRIIVASVNYKKRKTADMEEKLVRDYCQERNIPVFFLYPVKSDNDNFQKWARDVRYIFYKQLYDEYRCDGLLLGHQMDDHIETYLMDRTNNRISNYMGIQKFNQNFGMNIYRPLLNMRKSETRAYCLSNNVPFHDDESNFENDYLRNVIRHEMVEKATEEQISQWLQEIEDINRQNQENELYINHKYGNQEAIILSEFRKETHQVRMLMLRLLLRKSGRYDHYSLKQLENMENILISSDNGCVPIEDDLEIVYEYNQVYLFEMKEKYHYVLNDIECFSTEYFSIAQQGAVIEGVNISAQDFPIVIRPFEQGDRILLRYGHKKISRFLIDRKILKKERYYWPVIVNRNNEVIFASGIGCDINHYAIKPNLFMIK